MISRPTNLSVDPNYHALHIGVATGGAGVAGEVGRSAAAGVVRTTRAYSGRSLITMDARWRCTRSQRSLTACCWLQSIRMQCVPALATYSGPYGRSLYAALGRISA